MSDPVSALSGASCAGYVTVREIGPLGMISLRGDLTTAALAQAVHAAVGLAVPGRLRIEQQGANAAGWMSPDEVLLILPYGAVAATLSAIGVALSGTHHLAVDVSDARAVFRIAGPQVREVLAKLCPVDLSPAVFQPGDLRRTRAAQVAAALWISGPDEFTLVSFRSVAGYVFDLLKTVSMPGSEVGLFQP